MNKGIVSKTVYSILLVSLFLSFTSCSGRLKIALGVPGYTAAENDFITHSGSSDLKTFRFSENTIKAVRDIFARNRALALSLTFYSDSSNDMISQIGVLTEDDVKNRVSGSQLLKSHPAVSVRFSEFKDKSLNVVICFEKEGSVPQGFFVSSFRGVKLLNAEVTDATVGWDFSSSTPMYAFAPNGGLLDPAHPVIDYSAVSRTFASYNSDTDLLPVIRVQFCDSESKDPVQLTVGGERMTVRHGESNSIEIPLACLKNPFSTLEVVDGEDRIQSILLKKADLSLLEFSSAKKRNAIRPYTVDPGLIIDWPKTYWRSNDYELFEWDRFRGVLFFDTLNYKVQDDFFKRLAFFVEKRGYKGKLLTTAQMEGMHGYNAHDYRAESLARFFEQARATGFALNEKELLLKQILIQNGLLVVESNGKIKAGEGAVISISQESPEYLRIAFVAHEGWHGLFFIDEEFRNTVGSVYYTLQATDPNALRFLFRYFEVTPSLQYDTSDDYLMKNEFMAYMLQRPVSQIEKYYVDTASRNHSQTLIKEEADYIIATGASGFEGAAKMLNDYVGLRWNLAAGRVWLLSR